MTTEITDPRVLALVRRLEQRYVDAVDSRRMDAWLDCFTEDGSYYVLGADNEADDLPLCLMMDDCRERLEDRATFVDEVWPGSYEDYQTRHFVQPLRLEADESVAGMFRSLSNFTVFATDARGRTSLFIGGTVPRPHPGGRRTMPLRRAACGDGHLHDPRRDRVSPLIRLKTNS